MGTYSTRGAARLVAVLTGVALLATVPIALAADRSGLRSQAAELRAGIGSLNARASTATLELYAQETELQRTQNDLDALAARRAVVARDRTLAQEQLAIARQAVEVSQSQLAMLVRALYERTDQGDPLVVLLGAESLDAALAGLDGLSRAAGQNNRIIEQAREARTTLAALDAHLAASEAELASLATATEQRASDFAATASARRTLIAGLRHQQGLNASRIAAIETQVRTAEQRTVAMSAPTQPISIVPSGPRTITVSTTGYSIRGLTATGMPTAPGVIAVDPSVIPLGTSLAIPGYGTGIAADTGGAVHGNMIDLWFPTKQQALAWGRRTVPITIP